LQERIGNRRNPHELHRVRLFVRHLFRWELGCSFEFTLQVPAAFGPSNIKSSQTPPPLARRAGGYGEANMISSVRAVASTFLLVGLRTGNGVVCGPRWVSRVLARFALVGFQSESLPIRRRVARLALALAPPEHITHRRLPFGRSLAFKRAEDQWRNPKATVNGLVCFSPTSARPVPGHCQPGYLSPLPHVRPQPNAPSPQTRDLSA